jgi:hypothetical protein
MLNNLSRLHPAGGPEQTGHLLSLTGKIWSANVGKYFENKAI